MYFVGTQHFSNHSILHQLTIETVAAMADCGRLRYCYRSYDICNVILPDPRSPYGLGKQIHGRWGFWFSSTVSSNLAFNAVAHMTGVSFTPRQYPRSAQPLKEPKQDHTIPNRSHHQLPSPPPLYRPCLHPNLLLHLDPNHALHLLNDKHDPLSPTPHGGSQHRLRRL